MKVPEAEARDYNRVWVCRKCKHKIRADSSSIRAGKILCRNCKATVFRPKKKEKKVKG